MSEAVVLKVRTGDCPCPGTPHTAEIIYLEPELTVVMASAGMGALNEIRSIPGANTSDVEAGLADAFLPRGIRSWTFLELGEPDPKDPEQRRAVRPVEVNRTNMERLLPFDNGGFELIEKAGELWMGRFMRPLVKRMSMPSVPGSMDGSIPANPPTGPSRRERSGRSSLNGGAGRRSAAPDR